MASDRMQKHGLDPINPHIPSVEIGFLANLYFPYNYDLFHKHLFHTFRNSFGTKQMSDPSQIHCFGCFVCKTEISIWTSKAFCCMESFKDICSHDYLIVFWSDFRGEKNQLPRKLAYPLKYDDWTTIFFWNGPFSDNMLNFRCCVCSC